MAIFKLNTDSQATSNVENTPAALQKPNESMFTTLFPESQADSLLKYVEGYPWSCHYYGQLTSQANTLEHFDPTVPNLTQPYYEIKDMILQVTSPLNNNYDPATGVTTSSGSATAPLGVKPNVGDLFIAQIDSGEDAIFCVTSVERMTYRKSALYDINYSLYTYSSDNPGFIANLLQRVQQTYHFNKDTNYFNRDVLITPQVHEATKQLKDFMAQAQAYYLHTFADKSSGTIVLPGVDRAFYDPLLLQFLGTFIDFNTKISHPWFQYNWEDRYLEQKSIYDLLTTRNPSMVYTINKTYSFTPTTQLKNLARMGTIFHTPVDYILYPTDPMTVNDVDKLHPRSPSDIFNQCHLTSKAYRPSTLTVHTDNNNTGEEKQLLHDLFVNDSYVVSPHFYDYLNDNSLYDQVSFVEVLLARFIKRQAIARTDLLKVIESFYSWSGLHQLYILPVVILMIRATL